MTLIYKLLGIFILIASLIVGWFWQSVNQFSSTPVNVPQGKLDFTIEPGSGLYAVVNELATLGVIQDASKFRWMVRFDGKDKNIQAGEYQIDASMTPRDILAMFAAGKVKQYAFTIVEGWTFKQLLTAIGSNKHLKQTLNGKSVEQVMTGLGYSGEHPEGRFLPDTYHFPAGTSDNDFLKRAYQALETTLADEWQKRADDLPYKSAYEALIMASIVEKETAVAAERTHIAGVFVRRIKKNMRLQTDPTVIYGMGEKYDGNLRKRDLRKDTPYNTYRRKGLPPTPIALPGAAAINAALNPDNNTSLYFVAKGDGSHYFSETVEEHNKAVRQYQIRKRKTDYRSTPVMNPDPKVVPK